MAQKNGGLHKMTDEHKKALITARKQTAAIKEELYQRHIAPKPNSVVFLPFIDRDVAASWAERGILVSSVFELDSTAERTKALMEAAMVGAWEPTERQLGAAKSLMRAMSEAYKADRGVAGAATLAASLDSISAAMRSIGQSLSISSKSGDNVDDVT